MCVCVGGVNNIPFIYDGEAQEWENVQRLTLFCVSCVLSTAGCCGWDPSTCRSKTLVSSDSLHSWRSSICPQFSSYHVPTFPLSIGRGWSLSCSALLVALVFRRFDPLNAIAAPVARYPIIQAALNKRHSMRTTEHNPVITRESHNVHRASEFQRAQQSCLLLWGGDISSVIIIRKRTNNYLNTVRFVKEHKENWETTVELFIINEERLKGKLS